MVPGSDSTLATGKSFLPTTLSKYLLIYLSSAGSIRSFKDLDRQPKVSLTEATPGKSNEL